MTAWAYTTCMAYLFGACLYTRERVYVHRHQCIEAAENNRRHRDELAPHLVCRKVYKDIPSN